MPTNRHPRQKPPAPPDPVSPEDAAPRRLDARTRGPVIVFGLIALCTAYGEGALADWGARALMSATPEMAAARLAEWFGLF